MRLRSFSSMLPKCNVCSRRWHQQQGGRLPAGFPQPHRRDISFVSPLLSACSPSYSVAGEGRSCMVWKWKEIKKELEWLCLAQKAVALYLLKAPREVEQARKANKKTACLDSLPSAWLLWEEPLVFTRRHRSSWAELQRQQQNLLDHVSTYQQPSNQRLSCGFCSLTLLVLDKKKKKKSRSGQTNLLLSVYLSYCLFIYLLSAVGLGLSGHHGLPVSFYSCFCRLAHSHVTACCSGPYILTTEVDIFNRHPHYIKGLLSLWALFSLAKHFSPLF